MSDEALTYLNVGANGTFRRTGEIDTRPEDVDRLLQHLETQQIKKLAIHFHGGLIPEREGKKIAEKMRKVYADAQCHPVTFIWETGLVETVTRQLATIHQTKLFQKILAWVVMTCSPD